MFEKHGIYDVDEDGNLQGLPGPDRELISNNGFPRSSLPQ